MHESLALIILEVPEQQYSIVMTLHSFYICRKQFGMSVTNNIMHHDMVDLYMLYKFTLKRFFPLPGLRSVHLLNAAVNPQPLLIAQTHWSASVTPRTASVNSKSVSVTPRTASVTSVSSGFSQVKFFLGQIQLLSANRNHCYVKFSH